MLHACSCQTFFSCLYFDVLQNKIDISGWSLSLILSIIYTSLISLYTGITKNRAVNNYNVQMVFLHL